MRPMSKSKSNLKPIVKCDNKKQYLNSLVVSNFPENYENYDYIEPYVGGGGVVLNKVRCDHNRIEIINDTRIGIIQIYRALRDEPKQFIAKLKRTRCTERVFERELNKQNKDFDDYLDCAANEFIIQHMSRGGLKKTYSWKDESQDTNSWDEMLNQLYLISRRIEDVSILERNPIDVLKAFNEDTTLCYCSPPHFIDSSSRDDEMSTDDHITLSEVLCQFRGKVAISGVSSMLYNRIYNDWNCIEAKKTKSGKSEFIWTNY